MAIAESTERGGSRRAPVIILALIGDENPEVEVGEFLKGIDGSAFTVFELHSRFQFHFIDCKVFLAHGISIIDVGEKATDYFN